jgi:hypothetical protein
MSPAPPPPLAPSVDRAQLATARSAHIIHFIVLVLRM